MKKSRIPLSQRILFIFSVSLICLLFVTAMHTYGMQTREIYVSKSGSDDNDGSKAAPYLTINKAAQEALPGDTVIVGPGIYRELVQPARGGTSETNRITYISEQQGEAIIKGSEQITNWVLDQGNTWKVQLNNSFFGNYNPYTAGHGKDTNGYFPVYNCGDVYLNGEAYYQKATVGEVNSGKNTWYSEVNSSTTTIYANFGNANPNESLAEINVRKQCFAPGEWGLAYITVNGFGIQHAANMYSDFPGYPHHAQAGAISVNGGLKWIIENNTIVNARTIGIDIGLGCDLWGGNRNPVSKSDQIKYGISDDDNRVKTHFEDIDKYGQHIVRNNLIQKCGQSGICGVFSWKSELLNNVIEDTNYRNEFCAAETGGIKLHYCNDGLIKGNYVSRTMGPTTAGIWTDWGCQGIRITENVLVNNTMGYYAEAVVGPILVDNNIFIANNRFRSLDGAGITFANNLFYNETLSYDGEGRNALVFEPHTLNAREVYSKPQYFYWFNNITMGKPLTNPKGTNNRVEFNSSNAGSDFKYKVTADSLKISFNMDASPFGYHPLITPALVGDILPAGEGIREIVEQDYFGNKWTADNLVAGPFADIVEGYNEFTVWPREGITVPKSNASVIENLALDKPVTASSNGENGIYPGQNAVDGNTGSRWVSEYTDDEWIYVDLGEKRAIESIKILWESARAKEYKLFISDDAQQWTEIYHAENGSGGTDIISYTGNTRYVKMQGIKRNTNYGYSIYEFQIFGDTSTLGSQTPPVFAEIGSKKTDEGQKLEFSITANAEGAVTYGTLGYLPEGILFDSQTGTFTWTPKDNQAGTYPITFTAEYLNTIGTKTVIITVADTLQADITAPSWQGGQLTITNVKDTTLTLNWSAASDDRGVAEYRIYQNGHLLKKADGTLLSSEVDKLDPETSYTFIVQAVDESGNASTLSESLKNTCKTKEIEKRQTMGYLTSYPSKYSDWANSFLGGDGKIGIMVFGNPLKETVVFSDRLFNMAPALDKPTRTFNDVPQATLDEIKRLCVNGEFKKANDLANEAHGWKNGGEGSKHPGYMMNINMLGDTGHVTDYSRTLDYSTGEITVNWSDNLGTWRRTAFVSRRDNVAVQYLEKAEDTGTKINCTIQLTTDPGMHFPSGMRFVDASTEDYLSIHAYYPENTGGAGYEGVTRVVVTGANAAKSINNGILTITNADSVLLLTRSDKYESCETEWAKGNLQTELGLISTSYEELMQGQIDTHKEIFDRVTFSLNADEATRAMTNEELLALQKQSSEPVLALYERIFDAGRYHYLSSSSDQTPPDLLGNWTGDCSVGWDGFYHLDANLNLQIASGNIGNMPEAMAGYFNLVETWTDDFKINASNLLGCDGVLAGGNTPGLSTGLISALSYDYVYQYVTGEESWLLYPFWEYYQITGDEDFLKNDLYPILKELGYFYESFLTEKDVNGKYIFAGSISPETRPKGKNFVLANNSTFDIQGAEFALEKLIKTCEILGITEGEDVHLPAWKELLENLPPYQLNPDGSLKEWAWDGLEDDYGHRHSSHLIGVWPYRNIDAEDTPELYDAAVKALALKDRYSYEGAGHGYLHAALIAAKLNNGSSAISKIQQMLKNGFYYNSLATAHYANQGVFCTDVANAVPGIIMEMLLSSDEDSIELLPAITDQWKSGSISGLKAKNRTTVQEISWDLEAGTVHCILLSDIDQTLTIIQRKGIESIVTTAETSNSSLGSIAKQIKLTQGVPVEFTLQINSQIQSNLALNKPAEASSISGTNTVAKAFDGDMGSRWGASENAANWIQVDLGANYAIDLVKIYWEDSYAKGYKIMVSNDKQNWTDAFTETNSNGGLDEIQLKNVEGRYIRMQGVEKSGQWGYSIYEFEVYGSDPIPQENIALNKIGKAFSESNKTDRVAQMAFDGDLGTRWGANQNQNDWLQVDLEQTYHISGVTLHWEDSYAKRYEIQVSMDGEVWNSVFTENSSSGGVDEIAIPEGTIARYVRMQGREMATQWGFSIWEFQVYGTLVLENVAINKPAKASSESTSGDRKAENAFDGDLTSRWGADESINNWIQVNLEEAYNISKVVLHWEDSYAKAYEIQTSMDGEHWTAIYTELSSSGGINTILLDHEELAQYVRMQGKEKATQYGYSLWEFEVYGTKAPELPENTAPYWIEPKFLEVVNKTHNSVTLRWGTANDDVAVTGYRIYKDGELLTEITAKRYDVLNLNPETEYTFQIEAVDAEGLTSERLSVQEITNQAPKEPVNKDNLNLFIERAETYSAADYTEESFEILKAALAEAKRAAADEDADQEAIDAAAEVLENAINGLQAKEPEPPIVHKEELTKAIAEAYNFEESIYTETSFGILKTALELAERVLVDEDASTEDVENALHALNQAISGLQLKEPVIVDKEELTAAITNAKSYQKSNYTASSYGALETALELAEGVLANEDASKEMVDMALLALRQAISGLIKSSGNVSSSGGTTKKSNTSVSIYPSSAGKSQDWRRDSIGWWLVTGTSTYAKNEWKLVDGRWYYFDNSGYMATGWRKLNNDNWYFMRSDGAMHTGWLIDNGVWYYLRTDGAMHAGWLLDSGVWYYLNRDGKMTITPITYQQKIYQFNEKGACLNP